MTAIAPLSALPFGDGQSAGLVARKYRLDNGLSVILLRDPSAPIIAYQTWFRVGSRNEHEGRTGIAHLFEHLMFNQTKKLPPGEFDKRIESVGGETNAATWVDWTYYVDSGPKAALPTLIELESERMHDLVLGHDQVESEREVVANERRLRVEDAVEGTLSEELYKLAFEQHPYHWPTIGWMKDIHAITIDDCRAFYRTYYAPNNATLVLVGDFDETGTLAALNRAYGGIAAQTIPEEHIPVEPTQTAPRRAEWHKAVSADRVQIGWRAVGQGDADHAALEVASEILSGGSSFRLYRALLIERELVSDVQTQTAPYRDPGLFELNFNMTRGHRAEEAEKIVEAVLAELAAKGPTDAEVRGARARLLTHFWMGLRQAVGKAEGLGHAEVTLGDYRRLFEQPRRLDQIDATAVQRAVAKYLVPARRTTVIARPLPGHEEEDDDEPDEN